MAKEFVIYKLSTGEILNLHKASDASTELYPINPSSEGRVDLPFDHVVFNEQHKWRIVGGAIVLKEEVTVVSNKSQIIANGVDESIITFSGLLEDVKVTLGDELRIDVLTSDPILIVTSDVPRQFEISVSDMLHWSNFIIVEAR